MKKSIQLRIIISFLIIAAVSSGSVVLISIQQATAKLRSNAVEHFGEMAEEQYYIVEKELNNGFRDARLLSNNPVITGDAGLEYKREEMLSKKDIFGVYEDITLIDAKGDVLTSTDYGFWGDWGYREVFKEAIAGHEAMSSVYMTAEPPKAVITFAAPVFGPDSKVNEVIAIQLNMEEIWDGTDHFKVGETGYVYILDEYGRYVAHPDKGLILFKPDAAITREIEGGLRPLNYEDSQGVEFVGNYYPGGGINAVAGTSMQAVPASAGWKVVVVQESSEVFRLIGDFQRRAIVFAFIVFLLVLLLGVWFSRTITRPLRQLTVGAEAVGKGDYDHRVEVKSQDEIGRLANTFNLMAEALSGDIAARQQSAQALSESEELYRRLVETSPDAITLTDLEANVVVANQQAASLFGFASPEQMIGENFFDYVVEEDLERARRVYYERPQGGVARNIAYLMQRRDGNTFPAEVSASLVPDAEGRPRGFIGIVRDITRRRTAEEALRASEEKYRAVFEATGTAVCIIDAQGLISFVNQEFAGITGLSMEELEGKKQLASLLLEEDRETFIRNLRHAVRGPAQVPLRFPLRLHKSSGEEVHTLGNMARVPGTDTMVISLVDVTREWKNERTLENQTQQLRDFLSIASHELRHPITLIKGYVELLAEELEGAASDSALLSLQRVRSSTERLALLGDELMDASRIEQDSFILFRTQLNMVELVRQAVREIEARGVDCSFSIKLVNACGEIAADQEKIYRLLIILLENAAKFSPPLGLVEVEVQEQPARQVISVKDRGIGIPDGERMRIFDRFYQVEDVLHHSNGLGLGLYIATEIVDAHGGRIWCDSREGGGSVFSFSLPL